MNISVEQLIANQDKLKDIFGDKRWNNGTVLQQREEVVYSLFHQRNWQQIVPEKRIIILEELEKIFAKRQKRQPCKIVMLGENSKYKDKVFDMIASKTRPVYFVREDYLLRGKEWIHPQKGIQIDINNRLNVELMVSTIHEGKHKMQMIKKQQMLSAKKGMNVTTEDLEVYLNFIANPNIEHAYNYYNPEDCLAKYRMQPIEYYAFEYGDTTTKNIFTNLEKRWGVDKGFQQWKEELEKRKRNIENIWNQKNSGELNYQGIQKAMVKEMVSKCASWYQLSETEIADKLCLELQNYEIRQEDRIANKQRRVGDR